MASDQAEPTDASAEPVAAPVPEVTAPYRTDRRVELQAQARRFATDEVKPIADEYDPQKRQMPRHLIEAMGAKGYFGIMVPEEFGGLGCGVFE
ncbi:MAG TPA: acyl-CoA dehydrogenase family protein [Jatrophihabitans sp.]|jgi:alkylation response protein AidB-like acyl-CoA dehydrogenase|nr:acyl-CoA dehydrogenase family protein [Jatrophihabitans sp.]